MVSQQKIAWALTPIPHRAHFLPEGRDAVSRRRFDHLVTEISVAANARIPRYDLWLCIHKSGCDPETLSSRATVDFCGRPLSDFLEAHNLRLSPRAHRRLLRAVERYDPNVPSPEELLFGAP